MGWGTTLYTYIDYHKQTYRTLDDVYSAIEETTNYINVVKDSLRGLALMTEPKKYCGEDDDPLSYITTTFNAQLKELEESLNELLKLQLLLDHWSECHKEDGSAITPPEGRGWGKSYLSE